MEGTQDKVPGQRSLDGDLHRFLVTNFTQQHNIRVLTQNSSQTGRKGQPDTRFDLGLVDSPQPISRRRFMGKLTTAFKAALAAQLLPSLALAAVAPVISAFVD